MSSLSYLSLSAGLTKKNLNQRPVSIAHVVTTLPYAFSKGQGQYPRPYSLRRLIKALETDGPLRAIIVSPVDGQNILGQNVTLKWTDPGRGSSMQADTFEVYVDIKTTEAGQPPQFTTPPHLPHPLTTSNTEIHLPVPLPSGKEYAWSIRSINLAGFADGPSTAATFDTIQVAGGGSTPTHRPTPPPTQGVHQIQIWNCNNERNRIYVWLLDRTTGQWQQKGNLDPQYDDNGGCPGADAQPMTITLENGRHYDIVAVDTQLDGCSDDDNPNNNDPTNVACRRYSFPNLSGNNSGATWRLIIP